MQCPEVGVVIGIKDKSGIIANGVIGWAGASLALQPHVTRGHGWKRGGVTALPALSTHFRAGKWKGRAAARFVPSCLLQLNVGNWEKWGEVSPEDAALSRAEEEHLEDPNPKSGTLHPDKKKTKPNATKTMESHFTRP